MKLNDQTSVGVEINIIKDAILISFRRLEVLSVSLENLTVIFKVLQPGRCEFSVGAV